MQMMLSAVNLYNGDDNLISEVFPNGGFDHIRQFPRKPCTEAQFLAGEFGIGEARGYRDCNQRAVGIRQNHGDNDLDVRFGDTHFPLSFDKGGDSLFGGMGDFFRLRIAVRQAENLSQYAVFHQYLSFHPLA